MGKLEKVNYSKMVDILPEKFNIDKHFYQNMVVKETSRAVLEHDRLKPTELNSSYCGSKNSSEQVNQTELNKLNTQANKSVRKYAYCLVRPML